ncbi:MAG: hypothetical protein JWO89_1675 [Verrucomicrobiaceae bacterium]|nr:hypothetical protein [Verrucomicrobiaceae bacterium]
MHVLILFAVLAAALPGLADVVAVDDLGHSFSSTGSTPDAVLAGGQEFATGFYKIQDMAWHGRDLWIANSPDLTLVRDLNGDGVADEYVLMGRSLGDGQHGLKGIAWGADGKLYLATQDLALMPVGRLDRPMMYHKGEYAPEPFKHASTAPYETAILRCDADGRSLEVVERGLASELRQIGFDDTFHVTRAPCAAMLSNEDAVKEDNDQRTHDQWSFEELAADLGHPLAARSVAAQEELMRRGESIKVGMLKWLKRADLTQRQRTWALWTLGRAGKDDVEIEAWFATQPVSSVDENTRVQCLRIIVFRMREFGFTEEMPNSVVLALHDPVPGVRMQAEEAIGQARQRLAALIDLLAEEQQADIRRLACRIVAEAGDETLLSRIQSDARPLVRSALSPQ